MAGRSASASISPPRPRAAASLPRRVPRRNRHGASEDEPGAARNRQGDRTWTACERLATRVPEPLVFVSQHTGAVQKVLLKNTIDLQWKIRPICNARHCKSERKTAAATTMKSNGKNNARNNGNCRKSGRVLTRRLVLSTPAKTIARRR